MEEKAFSSSFLPFVNFDIALKLLEEGQYQAGESGSRDREKNTYVMSMPLMIITRSFCVGEAT